MNQRKETRSSVGAPEREAEIQAVETAFLLQQHHSTDYIERQGVSNYLLPGERNAVSASELLKFSGYASTRQLRRAVERERAAGILILSSDEGYYLPAEDVATRLSELRAFERRTDARLRSNRISIRATKRAIRALTNGEIAGQETLYAD